VTVRRVAGTAVARRRAVYVRVVGCVAWVLNRAGGYRPFRFERAPNLYMKSRVLVCCERLQASVQLF
jgi:hypothetical protein